MYTVIPAQAGIQNIRYRAAWLHSPHLCEEMLCAGLAENQLNP
jgi:hypothetical protein